MENLELRREQTIPADGIEECDAEENLLDGILLQMSPRNAVTLPLVCHASSDTGSVLAILLAREGKSIAFFATPDRQLKSMEPFMNRISVVVEDDLETADGQLAAEEFVDGYYDAIIFITDEARCMREVELSPGERRFVQRNLLFRLHELGSIFCLRPRGDEEVVEND